MRMRLALLTALSALTFVLTSCGAESSGGNNQQISYKDMKSMVIDILKTEDAQKALQESAQQMSGYNGSGTKLLSVQDQEQVRLAVKDVMVSPEYDKVIRTLMTDTRFAGEFAKAVNKQNKDIHKELMKDPTYQEQMIKAFKTPEMDKMILEVLQSTQYKKQVMSLMQESMQNPLFRLEVLDLMKKAVQEELKPKPDEKVDKKSQDSGSGGDEGSSGDEKQSDDGGSGEGDGSDSST
ncbi:MULTISPECIES: spore germination lipoprotein GerD [Paenibacillus]|uniref:Germination protein n=1 Tax=Paenibacillus glycanilyticus TaxID=126569 RepID=A0ABQ6NWL3_9BACL|nr:MULTISPECIES: spore germination lipoprotein GerD [Paenibacillus]MCK9862697.1 spore germination lipoprotein GerD [Paenibacillus sp. ATY16]GMK48527.1 germination protein [Paenibacillus glycanilyticus]